jgi:hypothetical protein
VKNGHVIKVRPVEVVIVVDYPRAHIGTENVAPKQVLYFLKQLQLVRPEFALMKHYVVGYGTLADRTPADLVGKPPEWLRLVHVSPAVYILHGFARSSRVAANAGAS